MDQLTIFSDDRLITGCIYCGGLADTRDHVPSRIFLDPPFPTNLPVLPACFECNNGFSADEEYVACLVESAIAGSTNPECFRRPRVGTILKRSPALRARIEQAKYDDGTITGFQVEVERLKNVILKLARGHVAYELSLPCRKEPKLISCTPLPSMSDEEKDTFDEGHVPTMLDEIGSRGQQRTLVIQMALGSNIEGTPKPETFLFIDWVEVQENLYQYLTFKENDEIVVRILLGGYLACEVIWDV